MSSTLPLFTPIEDSLFLTLCGRALDNHLAHHPRRPHGRGARRQARLRLRPVPPERQPDHQHRHRARKLDEVPRTFLTRHPDAVGLDLGAGLDTRVFRLDPAATVDWYDVDYPEVITARHWLLPARANAHTIAADLTDPDWLDVVPADRPAVIVADGLMAFRPRTT